MKTAKLNFCNIALLCCIGCNGSKPIPAYEMIDVVPVGWRMTPDDVVLSATKYCEDAGISGHIHRGPPTIVVDEFDGERYWCLGYIHNSKTPGDHFSLLVNDSTGEVEYLPGE